MLTFDFKPYCQNCTELTPLSMATALGRNCLGDTAYIETVVFCEHREKCKAIYDRMKEDNNNANQ